MMPARLTKIPEAQFIMKRSVFHSTHPVPASTICFAGLCTLTSVNLQADDVQVGRYSLFSATPTEAQTELLATTVTVRFPKRIQTLGEAVRYLLQRSGYRLAAAGSIGPDTVALFTLPLPAVHRSLGPMTLRDALGDARGAGIPSGPGSRPSADHIRALCGGSGCCRGYRDHHRNGGCTG